MTDAAIWLRVSTTDQHEANQLPDLERFCEHHGYNIRWVYTVEDSAWQDDKGGPEYQATLQQAFDDAWRGDFSVFVVWALDRITRLGAEDLLRIIREFRERGCTVLSVQESWLNTSPEIQDVLVALAGWVAQQESRRRSRRTKAGIARRKAQGLPFGGRQPGAKDKKKRRTDGYRARWAS
jgi:DNA invertase Pin-like site-specific DNA recombinase